MEGVKLQPSFTSRDYSISKPWLWSSSNAHVFLSDGLTPAQAEEDLQPMTSLGGKGSQYSGSSLDGQSIVVRHHRNRSALRNGSLSFYSPHFLSLQ